jgi:aminomethyltransferase
VVAWDKPSGFCGKAALVAEREHGPSRRLRGLATEGRQPPRQGYPVLVDGKPAGEVTSGNYSPVLEHAIALALLPPDVEAGAAVELDVRGRSVPAAVVATPFVAKKGK